MLSKIHKEFVSIGFGIQIGMQLVFMPYSPGVYVCLNKPSNEGELLDDDKISVKSTQTSAKIKKEVSQWTHLLDLESLDRKSNQILM